MQLWGCSLLIVKSVRLSKEKLRNVNVCVNVCIAMYCTSHLHNIFKLIKSIIKLQFKLFNFTEKKKKLFNAQKPQRTCYILNILYMSLRFWVFQISTNKNPHTGNWTISSNSKWLNCPREDHENTGVKNAKNWKKFC